MTRILPFILFILSVVLSTMNSSGQNLHSSGNIEFDKPIETKDVLKVNDSLAVMNERDSTKLAREIQFRKSLDSLWQSKKNAADSATVIRPLLVELPDPKDLFVATLYSFRSGLEIKPQTTQKPTAANSKVVQTMKKYGELAGQGELRIESYYSNGTTPFQLNEAVYTRIYANPSVSIFGLPFRSDIYYTTENNQFYNTNGFGLSFDPNALKEKSTQRLAHYINQKKSEYIQFLSDQEKMDRYESDLKRLLPDQERQLRKQERELDSRIAGALQRPKNNLNISSLDVPDSTYSEESLNTLLPHPDLDTVQVPLDSISPELLVQYDKLKQIQEKIRVYKKYSAALSQIRSQYQKYDSAYITLLNDHEKLLQSKLDQEQKSVLGKVQNNGLVQKIKGLNIGVHSAFYSEHSITGIPVKGLTSILEDERGTLQFTAGRTMSQFGQMSTKSANNNLFDRNILAAKYSLATIPNSRISLIAAYFQDSKGAELGGVLSQSNLLSGVGITTRLLNKLRVEAQFLGSSTSNSQINGQRGFESNEGIQVYTPVRSFFKNYSVNGSAQLPLEDGTQLKYEFIEKNAGFRSFGDPFHLRDYRQMDFQIQKSFFKQKLHFNGFYKIFRTNLSEIDSATNQLKGAGLTLNSSFKNKPNFTLSYLPFQQSNNHADTLFRTNNQFSTTTASVYYSKKIKRTKLNWTANYTRSLVEYYLAGNKKALTTFWTFNQQSSSRFFTTSINYTYSLTSPGIDSMNFQSLNLGITRTISSCKLGLTTLGKKNSSGGYVYGASLNIEREVTDQFLVSIQSGYRQFHRIWGMNHEARYFGAVNLRYSFEKKSRVIKAVD